jgi:hypothetical protein
MMTRPRSSWILLAALAGPFVLTGCGGDDSIWEPRGSSLVTLSFENLYPLSGGMNYQGWVVESRPTGYWGSPLGMFNVDESGQLVDPATGEVVSGTFEAGLDAEDVFGVQVSVENSSTLVSQPSATFILGGVVASGTAELGQVHWLAMNLNFTEIAGSYFLGTPSDDLNDNELSGVWFGDTTSGDPVPGLFLPEAPNGWDYEGWVVIGDDTLSTGKFYEPSIADTTNLYGGVSGDYPFPGQDFLENAPEGMVFPTDLSGAPLFLTLEPWEESDIEPLSPFKFPILRATIPADATAGTTYTMTSLFNLFPRGTAVVQFP